MEENIINKKIFYKQQNMGNVQPLGTESQDQSSQLKLNIQYQKKPVVQDLKHLLNWSLSEIRQIYAPFRRRKGSPVLTRSEFLRFIQLSRITSFHVYDCITKNQLINVFQILAILVIGAYTNYIYKLQFLFNIFDLRCKKKLSFSELILAFKSIIRGYCFLTDQPLPENQLLQKFGHALFSKADLNNDQLLQIGQIIGWLETTGQNLVIFKLFDPPLYGKEDYHIFNSFVPYTQEEINVMHNRLNKIYCKQKLCDQDYMLLKPIVRVRKLDSSNMSGVSNRTWGQNGFHKSNSMHKQNRNPKFTGQTLLHNNNSMVQNLNKSPFHKQKQKQACHLNFNQSTFLPQISSNLSKYHSKKKFQNIIIIKGRTITKKEVFDLRQYFDGMSVGKKHILIQDFIQNFNQEQYNHMKSVAASLFNFLDKKQNGKIQFLDLVTKLYPNLSAKHLQTISVWSDEYNRNFNMDKKIKANRQTDELKKRVLPKTCITRLEQLFRFFDSSNKGYVDLTDLQNILGNACTKKQISTLFESSDVDCDGKLTLKEFVHVLLPPDLEIQGLM